jgi:hypothetical protein
MSSHQPLMAWIVAKKISVEALKDTRPEKELSSDSDDASEGDGMRCSIVSSI